VWEGVSGVGGCEWCLNCEQSGVNCDHCVAMFVRQKMVTMYQETIFNSTFVCPA